MILSSFFLLQGLFICIFNFYSAIIIMKINRLVSIISAMFISCLFIACNGHTDETRTATITQEQSRETQVNTTTSQFPQIKSQKIEVKTFEVRDSAGKSQGWGYDIVVDSKKMIHQPIIPAIAGNHAFKTEQDAYKTGQLAAEKMRLTGSLPTLSVKELDSIGITK